MVKPTPRTHAAAGPACLVALAAGLGCSLILDPPPLADGAGPDAPDVAADAEVAPDGADDGSETPADVPDDGDGTDGTAVCGNGTTEPGEECDGDPPRNCPSSCGSSGTQSCVACDWSDCAPPAETCNGLDDDCNGVTDDLGGSISCGDGCCNGTESPTSCPSDCSCSSAPRPPTPLWPPNGWASGSVHSPAAARTLRPTFRWLAPPDDGCPAPSYAIQVDDSCTTPGFADCDFPTPEIDSTGAAGALPEHTAASPLAAPSAPAPVGRRYYWRVRACRGAACSAWSRVRYLEVGRVRNDFDGDGFSDLLAGAPGYRGGDGRALMFHGAASPHGTADRTWSEAAGSAAGFGFAAAGLGDVDADGFGEFAVGAPFVDGSAGTTDSGKVCYLMGGLSPPDYCPRSSLGSTAGRQLGWAVAGAGDVNGDGFADVLTGAPGDNAERGRADLSLGTAAFPWTWTSVPTGADPGDRLGAAVAGLGDLNGDGYGDWAVGLPGRDLPAANDAGAVQVFLGRAAPTLYPTPDLTLLGPGADARFGSAITALGDVDGDCYEDFAVGAPGACDSTTCGGAVFVYLGGPTPDATADLVLRATTADDEFGRALSGGDVLGDDLGDLLVGAPGAPVAELLEAGRLARYAGTPGGLSTVSNSVDCYRAGARFGEAVGRLGDVDADGIGDLAVGSPNDTSASLRPGRVLLVSGSGASGASIDLAGENDGERFGASIAAAAP